MITRATIVTALVALAGCGTDAPADRSGRPPDPNKAGLAFGMAPMDAVMKAPFELIVRINDGNGVLKSDDSQTEVTVKLADSTEMLGGTLTRRASGGLVRFDDLRYADWQTIKLAVSAPGLIGVTTPPFPVRPVMALHDPPVFRVRSGTALEPLVLRLQDGEGMAVTSKPDQTVTLAAMPGAAEIEGGADRTFVNGEARWERVVPGTAGAGTLVWRSSGLADLMQGMAVYDMLATEARWMPGGRVGVGYSQEVVPGGGPSGFTVIGGALPRGLTLDAATGRISGTPTESRHARLDVVATAVGGVATLYLTDLSIFPGVETPAASLDALDKDGPFGVGALDDVVDVVSRGKTAKIRVFHPAEGGAVSAGKFPLVVFHHGAANTDGATFSATIYDRYDPLLRRWASWGFIVVTIDGLDLIFPNRMWSPNTYAVLAGISENQRATITHMRAKNDDAASPLRGHVDGDRVILAGHSRGGGGSLVTSRTNPEVIGAILLKPIDPIMASGGEATWSGDLPPKPFLINIAGSDNDVIYPVCDYLYERRTSLVSAHTMVGSVHNYTKASHSYRGGPELCPPEPGSRPEISREQDHAITNAYAVAFLRYLGHGEIAYAPLLFDRPGLSTGLSPLGTLTRGDRFAAPVLIDNFQSGDGSTNLLGGGNMATGFTTSENEPSMRAPIAGLPNNDYGRWLRGIYSRPQYQSISNGHRLAWSSAGATWTATFPAQDVGSRGAFVFRARSDAGSMPGTAFSLKFTDAAGGSATLTGAEYVGANGLGNRYADVVVPVGEIRGSGADVSRLTSVSLVAAAPSGALLMDDLRFE